MNELEIKKYIERRENLQKDIEYEPSNIFVDDTLTMREIGENLSEVSKKSLKNFREKY
ncbi:MAG: hypothetical protein E6729_05550 [Finegoldia magna]|uniref:Uncharacterized protein n=1 Tax=Finegoldia dalianensis TaxID=3145239 RepID=A0ABW9KGT3_9FIRM|nr:hypothetical protein [Finegoldia magna]